MKVNIDLEVVKQTNKVWGFEYMTALCMEEFAEVIQAINKVRRKRNDDNLDHLNEEIADCLICIEQLKDMGLVDDAIIQRWIDYKQNRQQIRNKIKQNEKSSGEYL